ncbi:MAG: YiiD C-terminal domain-containing protein [Halomonas sp.]|nr:YiiD C-terminal domain-containing protein [Halomonas sp.]
MRQPGVPFPRLPLPGVDSCEGQGEDLETFSRWLTEAIPLVGHLGLKRMYWQGDSLVWDLALSPNLNDKGTGFGGSLAAQTTLIGWCWTTLWLRAHQREQDVVVAQASQRFLAPVDGDYRLECRPRDEDGLERLESRLKTAGKGRLALVHRLYAGDVLCLEAQGEYAVLPAASMP